MGGKCSRYHPYETRPTARIGFSRCAVAQDDDHRVFPRAGAHPSSQPAPSPEVPPITTATAPSTGSKSWVADAYWLSYVAALTEIAASPPNASTSPAHRFIRPHSTTVVAASAPIPSSHPRVTGE